PQYPRYPPQNQQQFPQGAPPPGRAPQPYGGQQPMRDPNMGLPPRGASRHGHHPPGTAGRNVPPGANAGPKGSQYQPAPPRQQMGGGPPPNFVSPAAAVFAQGGGWGQPGPKSGVEPPPSPGGGRPPPQGQFA